MLDEERDSIARYEEAKTYLPMTETVAGLAPSDFDHSAYPEYADDRLVALDCYLKELRPYTMRLVRAAELRQDHYERFIVRAGRIEERGHRLWREEMNNLAAECQSMLTYWQNERELAFDSAVETSEKMMEEESRRERVKVTINLRVRNVEYDVKEKAKKHAVPRPRLSKAEKKRRKKILKKLEADAIQEGVEEFKPVYEKIKEFHTIAETIINVEQALLLCRKVDEQILNMEPGDVYEMQFIYCRVQDTHEKRKKLFNEFVMIFYKLYLLKKRMPERDINHACQCLVDEFNIIYLHSICWTSDGMIAGNGLFGFLLGNTGLLADLNNTELMELVEPIELLISAIIWVWPCDYLISTCKRTMTSNKYSLSTKRLLKAVLEELYPSSFYTISTPFLEQVFTMPDPKVSALALYRQRDARVILPERNIRLFKEYFGRYPVSFNRKRWLETYKKFLLLIDRPYETDF